LISLPLFGQKNNAAYSANILYHFGFLHFAVVWPNFLSLFSCFFSQSLFMLPFLGQFSLSLCLAS